MRAKLKRPRKSLEAPREFQPRLWWLYLLACQDGRTYAGIALDVDARFRVHLSGKGARFTRSNPPLEVLAAQSFETKSEALKAEVALKRLDRPDRLVWARRWAKEPSPARASSEIEKIDAESSATRVDSRYTSRHARPRSTRTARRFRGVRSNR